MWKLVALFVSLYILFPEIIIAGDSDFCKERLPENINSYQPAIVPVIHPEGNILYLDRQNHPQNNGKHLDIDDIWISVKSEGGYWPEPVNASIPYNSAGSNVLFGISPDGSEALIFSSPEQDNPNAGKYYTIEINNDNWEEPKEVTIDNYINFSRNFHANKSCDAKAMLFALEDSSSFGGLDIYISFLDVKLNSYGPPKNLGSILNTEKLESSPFLAYDMRTLYFSSERPGGSGKLDLYMSRRIGEGFTEWSEPVNLGIPINTEMNENSIYLSALSDTAYIVSYDTISKRQGIYQVCLPDSLKPYPYAILKGIVNNDDKKAINNSNLILYDEVTGDKRAVRIINNQYTCVLPEKTIYKLEFNLQGYEPLIQGVDLREITEAAYMNIETKLISKKEIVEKFNVYFEYDSFELSPSEQQKIMDYFASPGMFRHKITITGHTDSAGSDIYNLKLSQRRADTVKGFLSNLNIPKPEFISKGKGETETQYSNDAENRRAEIEIRIIN